MMKVVINKCYGGFGLSKKAILEIHKRGGKGIEEVEPKDYYGEKDGWEEKFKEDQKEGSWASIVVKNDKILLDEYRSSYNECLRDCPVLISVVEELGEDSYGNFAKLKVVEVPDGVKYKIEEYDGMEWVAEEHRTWG